MQIQHRGETKIKTNEYNGYNNNNNKKTPRSLHYIHTRTKTYTISVTARCGGGPA